MSEPPARIRVALELLGREYQPPPGWEARVLARVRPRRPRRPRWWAIPAIALVAIAVVVWPIVRPEHPPGSLELTLQGAAGPIAPGGSAHVGDVVAAAASGGERYRAIRVYRDDQLIAVCPGSSPCELSGGGPRARIALAAHGTYAFVALSSARPIPPARGSYGLDLEAAHDVGAATRVHRVVAR